MRARGDLKVLTAEHRMPPDIAMKRPVPQHLQAHSLRGALAEGDDWEDFAEDDNASDCSWSAWDDPPLVPKAAPSLSSTRPRWSFRRRQAATVGYAYQTIPPPEDEPTFSDTLMELCGTLDDIPDEQAHEESLLDPELTNSFKSVSVSDVRLTDSKSTLAPNDASHLGASDPQIPSDVIIVDVAVDNHTQGIVIEDGPCAGISLSTIQPYMPPRMFVPRKPRLEEDAANAQVAVVPERPKAGVESRAAPAVPDGSINLRSQAAPQTGLQLRANPERRHTLPAGGHVRTPQQTISAPARVPATAAPAGRPPPREREPLPVTRRVPRGSLPAAAASAAGTLPQPTDVFTPYQPRGPGAHHRRRESELLLAAAAAAAGNTMSPAPHPTISTDAGANSGMFSSAMVTSPMLTSPLEAPFVPGSGGPRRKSMGRPRGGGAGRHPGRSTNPLPTPDATRPATPLVPEGEWAKARTPPDGESVDGDTTARRRPGRPKKSHSEGFLLPAMEDGGTSGDRKGPGRPRKRVESVEEVESMEMSESMDARAARRLERSKAAEQPAPAAPKPRLIIRMTGLPRPTVVAASAPSGATPTVALVPTETLVATETPAPAEAPVPAEGMETLARKRAASQEREEQPPSPKRIKTPDLHDEAAAVVDITLDPVSEQHVAAAHEDEGTIAVPEDINDQATPMEVDAANPVTPAAVSTSLSSPSAEEIIVKDNFDVTTDDESKVIVYRKETDSTLVNGEFANDGAAEHYHTPESLMDASEDVPKAERELSVPVAVVEEEVPQQETVPVAAEGSNDDDGSQPDSDKTMAGKGGMSPDLAEWVQVTPILSDGPDDKSDLSSVTSDKAALRAPSVVAEPAGPKLPLANYVSDDSDSEADVFAAHLGSRKSGAENKVAPVNPTELERLLFHDLPETKATSATAPLQAKGGSETTEEEAESDDSELDPALNSISGKPTVIRTVKSAALAVRYEDEDELVI